MIGGNGSDGTRVRQLAASEDIEALVRLFEAIAREEGWQPGDRLRRYGPRSLYLAGLAGGEVAGGCQLVFGDTGAVPPGAEVWPELGLPRRRDAAHVAILALRREHRGDGVLFRRLCVELWRCCEAQGVAELWLEATPPTLAVYRRLGFPLEVVGGLREHWGEDCYLCRMGVAEVADVLAVKAARSHACREMVRLASEETSPG